jgi:alkanesulfonate monooxygenase SsuD/methylene tetrahydromethanopterin reductase-like flavin-dependent oxidoreductase (luciferase family)
VRIAVEAATVDQSSDGRLIFGVGRGGLPRIYEAYGIPYAESRDRFAETLEIIERAWSQPRFSFEGKYHRFDDVAVTPKPRQKPLPPIRVAASSPDTFSAIGRLGYPIFVMPRGTFADMARADRKLSCCLQRRRPSRARPGVYAGTALRRGNLRARPRRTRAEHHAFLPRAGRPAACLGQPRRHVGQRGQGRARRDARYVDL